MGSATMMPLGPTFEAQQSEVARQQELVKALMALQMQNQQGSGSIQAGNRIIPDWGSAIANMVGGWRYAQEKASLAEKERSLGETYNRGLSEGLDQYMKLRQGTPAEPPMMGAPGEQEEPTPGAPARAPDRAAAIKALIASGIPELRQMGMADFASLLKTEGSEYGTTAHPVIGSDGKPRMVVINKQGQPKELPGYAPPPTVHTTGESIWQVPVGGQAQRVGGSSYSNVGPLATDNNGQPVMGAVETNTNKPTFAPKGTSVNNALSVSAGKGQQDMDFEFMKERGKEANEIVPMLQSLARARNIASNIDPQMMGPGAGIVEFGGQLMKQLGGELPKGVVDLEGLDTAMGDLLLANARKLAPVTKEDIAELKGILGAKSNSKEGLIQKIDMAMALMSSKVSRYNDLVDAVEGNHTKAGWTKPGMYSHYKVDWTKSVLPPVNSELSKGGRLKFNPATGNLE